MIGTFEAIQCSPMNNGTALSPELLADTPVSAFARSNGFGEDALTFWLESVEGGKAKGYRLSWLIRPREIVALHADGGPLLYHCQRIRVDQNHSFHGLPCGKLVGSVRGRHRIWRAQKAACYGALPGWCVGALRYSRRL